MTDITNTGRPAYSPGSDTDDWFEPLPGERMRVRIGSAASGGRLTLLENIVEPGAAAPSHFHSRASELFIVLEGRILITSGDEQTDAGPGAALFLPSGSNHSFANVGELPARLLSVFMPGGMEAMFREAVHTPPEQIAKMAARHETMLLEAVTAH